MLTYFIIFTIIGFILGVISHLSKKYAVGVAIAIIISFLWMFAYGFWAIATFFELALGYALAISILANRLNIKEQY